MSLFLRHRQLSSRQMIMSCLSRCREWAFRQWMNSYGINVQTLIGTPGGYEFLRVLSVNYGTGRIDFTRNVYINTYDVAGNVQLIQVPFMIHRQ